MISQSELRKCIIFEDNHLIAINKKPGWLVQSDRTGDISLFDAIKIYIRDVYNKPGEAYLGTIHRLDRPVSGVVLFAKTSKALARMNTLFQTRDVKKTYYAIVHKRPKENTGTLENLLLKDTKNNTVKIVHSQQKNKEAKLAILSYDTESVGKHYTLLKIQPDTGRPHQIRVQLSGINCPIAGDTKYGSTLKTSDQSICLHSYEIEFIHPVKKEPTRITAQIPNQGFWKNYLSD